MKSHIITIGNSRGVRIPKLMLEQTGLAGEVEISVRGETVVIRRVKKPRAGWAVALQEMARRGDDALVDEPAPSLSEWDEGGWQWQ